MNKNTTTYHIIGGGIAGLSAAKFIKDKNKNHRVILYEASHKIGGRCFSFYDEKLKKHIDNATHVVLGANKNTLKLYQHNQFDGQASFWEKGLNLSLKKDFWQHALLSVFNTAPQEVPLSLIKNLLWKLFPFLPCQLKLMYSKGNLSSNLIEPLSKNIDEIKFGFVLKNIETSDGFVNKLIFNKSEITINQNEKIICALDAHNYHQIFGGETFDFNEITNVFFRTSTPLCLPKGVRFLATPNNIGDWIFVIDDIVNVTISNSNYLTMNDDALARILWKEIRAIQGIMPAFLPPYRVFRYRQATIKQDAVNNHKRPNTAKTKYKNMVLAGDWTMKDWPCCIEAAIASAKRAVKY